MYCHPERSEGPIYSLARRSLIFLIVAVLSLTPFAVGGEGLKLKITSIEEISHDSDKDECGVVGLPCHTREEYKVMAHNDRADFVLSCKTDYVSYFKSAKEVAYVPPDKPMKVCMVFFHVGDTVSFREERGGWVPDDRVKDDAIQPFTITSEKAIGARAK
jgi:hypothetical protein